MHKTEDWPVLYRKALKEMSCILIPKAKRERAFSTGKNK